MRKALARVERHQADIVGRLKVADDVVFFSGADQGDLRDTPGSTRHLFAEAEVVIR
jgi:hypothetical protein